jgi:hypothetical protein
MSAKPEEPCAKPSKKCGLCAGDAGGDDGRGYPFPEPILYRARGSVCCEACYEENEDLLETARVPVPGPSDKTCCWCKVDVGELGKSPYPLALRPKVCCDACYDNHVVCALKTVGPSKPCCLCDHDAGEFGNNPFPLGAPPAVCCDACNAERVMPARLGLAAKSRASSARA